MSPMHAKAAQTVLATAAASVLPAVEGWEHERCDVCGHRAYVMTLHGDNGLPLSWCGHHFREHGSKLTDDAGVLVVIDNRARLVTI